MHVCTADAWQSGKPRVECATNARVHNFARQFWQLATQRIRHSVSCTTQQQQLHWQRNRKIVDQTHRGKGCLFSLGEMDHVERNNLFADTKPHIDELIAHFRLLNFGSVAMQISGFGGGPCFQCIGSK